MRIKNLFFLVLAQALLLSCTAQKVVLDLNPAFDPIRKTTMNERYEKALSDVEALPASGEKFSVIGFNYLDWAVDGKDIDASKTKEARNAFNAGIQADSLFPMNYVGLGRIALREGDAATATKYFNKAKSIVENKKLKATKGLKQATYIALANAQLVEAKKDTANAHKVLDLASVIDPNNLDLHLAYGDYQFYKNINNQSAAIKEYNKCLEIDPKFVPAIYRKAKLYKASKNYQEGLKVFNEAIAADPTFAPSYRERAELLKDLTRYDEAISSYEQYLQLNNSCRVQQRYATFFYLTQNYQRAIDEITAAHDCNPDNNTLDRVLGYSYLELKNYEEARKWMDLYFNDAHEKHLDVADYKNYSRILMGLGQDSLGITYLEKGIELFPEFTDGYNEIATIYTNKAMAAKGQENANLRIKYYTLAADWYQKKMDKLGEDPKDQFIQGQVLYFSQNYVKADTVFRKSSVRYPEAWFWVAKCENKLDANQEGRAKQYYEKAIVLVGEDPAVIEKSKKSLAEAYQYLGLYYGNKGDLNCSKAAWLKVLEYDPANKLANQLLVTPETIDQELAAAVGDCKLVTYPAKETQENSGN